MSLLSSDLLLQAVALVLALLGLLLALRTAIGDRARGRARCPKCWYHMDALRPAATAAAADRPAIRCPECGHTPRADRHWFRTRRSRLAAALAVLLLLAAAGTAVAPNVRRNGPRALIPTVLLLRLTDPVEWLDYHRGNSADVNPSWVNLELSLRIDTGRLTHAGARAIARSAERAYRRQGRLADEPPETLASQTEWLSEGERAESWRFAAYDLAPVVFTRGFCGCGARPSHKSGSHDCPLRAQLCTAATDVVQSLIDPMGWHAYGGNVSQSVLVGDQLLVYTDQQTHDAISRLLEHMRSRTGRPGQVAASDADTEVAACDANTQIAVWNITDLIVGDASTATALQRALSLREAIQSLIDPDSWLDFGGDEGAVMYLNGALIVAASHENQAAIAQLLAILRAADGVPRRIPGAAPDPSVAVYRVEPFLGELASPILIEHRPVDMPWNEMTREERRESIVRAIVETVAPDSWLQVGGEEGHVLQLDARLIISTSPDNHVRIARFLQELAPDGG